MANRHKSDSLTLQTRSFHVALDQTDHPAQSSINLHCGALRPTTRGARRPGERRQSHLPLWKLPILTTRPYARYLFACGRPHELPFHPAAFQKSRIRAQSSCADGRMIGTSSEAAGSWCATNASVSSQGDPAPYNLHTFRPSPEHIAGATPDPFA